MVKYSAEEATFDNSNPSTDVFRSHVQEVNLGRKLPENRLSLAPLDPVTALRALLSPRDAPS